MISDQDMKRMLTARDMISRAYTDTRFDVDHNTRKVRTLAVTTLWMMYVERPPSAEFWNRVRMIMGLTSIGFKLLIAADAPRYEPPDLHTRTGCLAPKARGGGVCGRSPQTTFQVTDPETGRWRLAGFCFRHRDYGDQVHRAERAVDASSIPEPVPNTGGLLPCYIGLRGGGWPDLYAWASSGWKPPAVGIRADDWPVMEKVVAAKPPALRVIIGGVEYGPDDDAEDDVMPEGATPVLQLVSDDD